MADEDTKKSDKDAQRQPAGLSDRLDSVAKRAMQDAEHRKRLAGSSGPASGVRRIDPKDYVPAPSSKQPRPPRKPG